MAAPNYIHEIKVEGFGIILFLYKYVSIKYMYM